MFVFSEEDEKQIEKILNRYPEEQKRSALLPLLTLVQRREKHVSADAMRDIGSRLDLSPAYVQSVCSFYTMYSATPVGKYLILFCINISCQLNGCDELLAHTARKLNIEIGETTEQTGPQRPRRLRRNRPLQGAPQGRPRPLWNVLTR